MQDLLKINYETEEPTVSARELYDRLNIKSNFTTWFRRMCEYGFEDGKDFFPKMEESTGGRPAGAKRSATDDIYRVQSNPGNGPAGCRQELGSGSGRVSDE